MAFWVVKAKRSRTDLTEVIRPGEVQCWRTKKPPKAWKPTDGIFLWQSSPDLMLRGIGTIVDIGDREDGEAPFSVRYEDGPYENAPTIEVLREDSRLSKASFLKAGAAGTVFPVDDGQSRALAKHLRRAGADRGSVDTWLEGIRRAQEPTMAISLRQPYAELILRGVKTMEFRSRPTKRRGRVFVYAAGKPAPAEVWNEHGIEIGSLPTGTVQGVVDIMTCVDLGDGYGYRLAHPERIDPRAPEGHPQPTWFRPFQ